MGTLSTHVIDTAGGKPAGGMVVELYQVTAAGPALVKRAVTNADGRCGSPLLSGAALRPGQYQLVFGAGDYFAAQGADLPAPRFIDRITLAFGVADGAEDYHVPLLVSPWSYSTYRGS
jgi:5-hydroxyisourate hydrolase